MRGKRTRAGNDDKEEEQVTKLEYILTKLKYILVWYQEPLQDLSVVPGTVVGV